MEVQIPCVCPEKDGEPRHESDTVQLVDVLDFHRATTITKAIGFIDNDDEKSRAAEVLATLSEHYVLQGIERWSLRDASNKPLEVSKGAIRRLILDRPDVAPIVVEAADSLYSEAVLLPLVARASSSSPSLPTDEPTSRKPAGKRATPLKRSKRSSISTIPTDGTGTISSSLVGDSSFSPSSESAA